MLWHKSWLDTRWRFLVGFALLICSAFVIVLTYTRSAELLPLAQGIELGGELGRRVKEAIELQRDYRGYIWYQWFRQTPLELATLFAVLLGSGSLVSQGSGSPLFTLSLPISRNRLLGGRAVTGLLELLVLTVVPSLAISLFSPAIGQHFGIGSALVHALCLFIVAAVFFSLALLLSTEFTDLWRPLLIAGAVAVLVGLGETLSSRFASYGLFTVMSGERYFRTGAVPWMGLLASIGLSAALLYGAALNFARRDF